MDAEFYCPLDRQRGTARIVIRDRHPHIADPGPWLMIYAGSDFIAVKMTAYLLNFLRTWKPIEPENYDPKKTSSVPCSPLRFIPVKHMTKKRFGVCDLQTRKIVQFHFRESQQDFLRLLEVWPDDAEYHFARLDSMYIIEPTKDWMGDGDGKNILAYDMMLATKI
jgi:hypothetical protein